MLYESDVANLLSQWQERLNSNVDEVPYRDCLNDCIYDLNNLMDKNFAEEALANESFEQSLMNDEGFLNNYFEDKFVNDGVIAI